MAPDSLTFLGGLLLGLASSLHCAGMCGAIASSLMFAFSPGGAERDRVRALMAAHAGRVLVYVAAGAAVGAVGSTLYGAFDHTQAFVVMRWAAAVALGWIGLSVAGFAPALSVVDRVTAPIAGRLRFASCARESRPGRRAGFGTGMGLLAVRDGVRRAVLRHADRRAPLRGATVMAGFGLGTLPSVTAVALGLSRFRRLAQAPNARFAVGLSDRGDRRRERRGAGCGAPRLLFQLTSSTDLGGRFSHDTCLAL